MRAVRWAVVIALFAGGSCGGDDDAGPGGGELAQPEDVAATEVTSAASSLGDDDAVFDGVISVSFDGSDCDLESPEEVPAGEVEFRLVNDDDVLVYPLVLRHLQDQPISKAVDFWGPDGSVVGNPPGWTVSIVAFGVLPGEQRVSPDVLRTGTYHVACVIRETNESWFGGGFVVVE